MGIMYSGQFSDPLKFFCLLKLDSVLISLHTLLQNESYKQKTDPDL